jgi:LemA protein
VSAGALILLGVPALAVWLISIYNQLVAFRNQVANAFAQIDVQLKRRHDLIPNLIEVARRYMSFERETLEAVIAARTKAASARTAASGSPSDPNAIASLSAAEGALSGSLGRLFAVAENYPDLKANEQMAQLSEELTSTENKVAFARQAFNDAVMKLNTAVASFPAVLFSGAFGFKVAGTLALFENPADREPVSVRF